MSSIKKNRKRDNILYKIYYKSDNGEEFLVYLGRTHQNLNDRLRGHFLKVPMLRELDPRFVSRIEYATFETEADMFLYEIYFINKLKPPLNKDDKSKEELTVDLPPVPFHPFDCPHLEKWSLMVSEKDRQHENLEEEKRQLNELYRTKRKEIFNNEELSQDEKIDKWWTWMETVYEPKRQELYKEK